MAGAEHTPSETIHHLARLHERLARHYPEWGADTLSIAGYGLNFLVYHAETRKYGPIALRIPWAQTLINDTDGILDTRRLLRQEAALTTHVRVHGIPAPAIHALHLGEDGVDFLASEFVMGDGSVPDPHAFGRLMRAIHTLPPPEGTLIEGGELPPHERLAARLSERATALERLTGEAFALLECQSLAAILAVRADQRALLHMDARPANFFTRRGEIVAIVDWGNALLGDPALELARIAESGHLDDGFLAGYGADPLGELSPPLATIYRLDTTVMLALVFLAEAPDPAAATALLARTRVLLALLAEQCAA